MFFAASASGSGVSLGSSSFAAYLLAINNCVAGSLLPDPKTQPVTTRQAAWDSYSDVSMNGPAQAERPWRLGRERQLLGREPRWRRFGAPSW